MADGVKTLSHARTLLRIRLMEHALVAVTGGTRFVGVDTRYNDKTVFGLFLNIDQAAGVIQNCVFVICGTRSDEYQELITFSADDFFYFFITFCFASYELRRKRELLFDLCRGRQLVYEFECHNCSPRFVNNAPQQAVRQFVCYHDRADEFAR